MLLARPARRQPPALRAGASGYTDGDGVVRLTLTFTSGAGGTHHVLFASTGTLLPDLSERLGPEVETLVVGAALWEAVLLPAALDVTDMVTMLRSGELQRTMEGAARRAVEKVPAPPCPYPSARVSLLPRPLADSCADAVCAARSGGARVHRPARHL